MKAKPLSASKIKTLQTCSWQYWANYHLGLPQSTNTGALKGTCCHTVFECLLKPRHRHIFDDIMAEPSSIKNSKSVTRYVNHYIKKNNLPDDSFDSIDTMIVVGLKTDFYCEQPSKAGDVATLLEPELAFDIKSENPEYHIKGFIDKPVQYGDKFLRIVDYKSSKKQFEGEDLKSNVQAMMYSLAGKHLYPNLRAFVDFLFLQFPDNPIQRLAFKDTQLKGFEHFLADIYKRTKNFTEKDAKANYAADQTPKDGEFKGQIVCGFAKQRGQLKKNGQPMWHCPVKFAFDYWVLCNEDGEQIKSAFTEEELKPNEEKGEFVIKKHYAGCPRWNKSSKSSGGWEL